MALATARDMIIKSLKLIGVGAEGEVPSFEMINDALDSLNLMLSLWGARGLMTLAEIQENFPLVASQASYTMGVTSLALVTDFNTIKPSRIISAFIRDASGNDTPLNLITHGQYNDIAIKTTEGQPDSMSQNPGATQQTNRVTTLSFYPVPDTVGTYTVYLFSEKPFTLITTLDDIITMDDIYKAAIIPNLALLIAPEYGRSTPDEIIKFANETLSAIETINSAQKKELVDLGFPIPESSNILTGS